MMDNYDRTIELVDAAYNSAGASQEQYEKTLDSLQSKLNNLANAWHEFITGISNSKLIKGSIDLLTNILTVVNNLTDKFGDFGNSILKTGVLLGGLAIGGNVISSLGKKFFPGLVAAITGKAVGNEGDVSKAGEFLGTTLLRSMTKAIRSDKTLVSSLSNKLDKFVGNFKRKGSNFKDAFYSFSSSLKSHYPYDMNLSEQKEFLKISDEYLDSYKQLDEACNRNNITQEEQEAILKRVNDAEEALNNSTLISTVYKKLNFKEQAIYNSLVKMGIGTKKIDLLMTNDQMKAALLRAAAEGKLNKELVEQQAAELGLDVSTKTLGSKLKNYTKLLFGFKESSREAEASILGLSKQAADGSTQMTKLGAAMVKIPWGWIALAIAAVAAAIAIIIKRAHDDSLEERLKRAASAAEDAKERVSEAKDVLDNLKSDVKDFNEIQDTFDDLAKGTYEWTQAIIENNKKVVELIENYRELGKYVYKDKDGKLNISKEGFDELEKEYTKNYNAAARRSMYANINQSYLEFESKASSIQENNLSIGAEISSLANRLAFDTTDSLYDMILNDMTGIQEHLENYFRNQGYEKDELTAQVNTELNKINELRTKMLANEVELDAAVIESQTSIDGYYTSLLGLQDEQIKGFDNLGRYARNLTAVNKDTATQAADKLRKWSGVGDFGFSREQNIDEIAKALGIEFEDGVANGQWWRTKGNINNRKIIDMYAQLNNMEFSEAEKKWNEGAVKQYQMYSAIGAAYQDALDQGTFKQLRELLNASSENYVKTFIASVMNPDALLSEGEQVNEKSQALILKAVQAIDNAGGEGIEDLTDGLAPENKENIVKALSDTYDEIGLSFEDLQKQAATFAGKTSEQFSELTQDEQYDIIIEFAQKSLRQSAKNLSNALQTKVKTFSKYVLTNNAFGAAATADQLNTSTSNYIGELANSLGEEKLTQINKIFGHVFSTLEQGGEKASIIVSTLTNTFKDGTEEDINALTKFVTGIGDYTDAVEVGFAVFEGLKDKNDTVKTFAENMKSLYGDEISASAQLRAFAQSDEGLNAISEDLNKIVEKGEEISDENLKDLAKSCSMLDKIIQQNIVSTGTLKDLLAQLQLGKISVGALTDRFLDFCDSLYTSNDLLNDVKNNIANFEEGLDSTEGVDFWKKQTDALKEFWEAENYGNPQAINILEKAFGKDYVDSFQGDDIIAAGEDMWKKLNTWTSGEGYGFWEDLANNVFSADGITATIDENGDIILDTANKSIKEIIAALSEGSGLEEEVVQSLWSAYLTHSPEAWAQQKKIDNEAAIKTLQSDKNSFLGQGKNWLFSGEEADAVAKQLGITRDEFISEWKRISSDKPLRIVDWIDSETGAQKTGKELKKALQDAFGTNATTSGQSLVSALGVDISNTQTGIRVSDDNVFSHVRDATVADVDELSSALENAGVYGNQLYEVLDLIGNEEDIDLSKKIQVVNADGVVSEVELIASSYADLQKQIAAFNNESTINQIAAGVASGFEKALSGNEITISYNNNENEIKDLGKTAMKTVQQGMDEAGAALIKYKTDNNTVFYNKGKSAGQSWRSGFINGFTGFFPGTNITTYASGTSSAPKTEDSLVGEIGPELLRRGDKATLVGKKGPEIIKVKKGDQIFPADVTKDILSGTNKTSFVANIKGHYSEDQKKETSTARKDTLSNNKNNTSKSSSSSGKDPYESALDIYHNFIVALSKLNNDLDDLVSERDKILSKESRALEAGDVEAVARAQKELEDINDRILKQQQKIVKENSDYISGLKYGLNVLENRFSKYNSVVDTSNGYINVNWEAYNNLDDTGKETVDDLISEWEDYNDRLEEAKDAIQEIIDYYYDLAEEYRDMHDEARDSFIDLINDLTDVLIEIDEKALKRQQEYYDQLIEQDEDYLDALRKNVEERRKIRDRENSYEDLAEKQRRLSLLKRDTSGVYKNEIASLEKEIADSQQDLTDQKIDDIIDNMEEDLDLRKEQFDRHIELMEDNINQAKENGEYARRAQELLEQQPEEAYRILTETNSEYLAMSSAEQAKYTEELKNQMIEMSRFMEGYYIRLAESMDAIAEAIKVQLSNALAALGQNSPNFNGSQIGAGAGPSDSGNGGSGGSSNRPSGSDLNNSIPGYEKDATKNRIISLQKLINQIIDKYNEAMKSLGTSIKMEKLTVDGILGSKTKNAYISMYNWGKSSGMKYGVRQYHLDEMSNLKRLIGFSKGGIVDFTGPAMVHGSKSKPEAFLDAEDTQNIANLRDALKELNISNRPNLNYGTSNFRAGDCTIYINVDQIASDYDIDRAIEEVQRKILSSSSYRNINLINRMR